MSFLRGLFCLAKLTLARYWFWILWSGICIETFRGEYLHYKLAPQFHYLRKMLGRGICISRGSAAVLNVCALAIVLTTCRNLYSMTSLSLPIAIHKKLDSVVVSSKSNHLAVAGTIVLTSMLHTMSHIANAINSSRNFVVEYPTANLATYRGENPSMLIFTTVPGITGILMMIILIILGVTSMRFVRRRNYERFYYTHHCGLLYLILIVMHPISGIIKAISNIDSHHPSCNFLKESKSTKKEILGEDVEFSNDTDTYLYITKVKKSPVDIPLTELIMDLTQLKYIEDQFENEVENSVELMKFRNTSDDNNKFNQDQTNPDRMERLIQPLDHWKLTEAKSPNRGNIRGVQTMKPLWSTFSNQNINSADTGDEYSICGELDKLFTGKPFVHYSQEISFMAAKKNKEDHTKILKQQSQDVLFENSSNYQSNQDSYSKEQPCHLPPVFTPVQSKTWIWICSALLLWLLEFSVGYMRGRGEVRLLQVVHYPNCDIAELSFSKKGFACHPGQFVLLRCPQISMFQWHPFTIARCPADNDGVLTVVMKTRGNWCKNVIQQLQRSITTTSEPDTLSKCKNIQDVECQHFYVPKGKHEGNEHHIIEKRKNSLLSASPCINYEQEINNVNKRHFVGLPISINKPKCSSVYAKQTSSQLKDETSKENLKSSENGIEFEKFVCEEDSCISERRVNYLNKQEGCEGTIDIVCKLSHCRIVYDVDEQLTDERFYMNGPFNSINEKLFSYNVVIGIAGGVGITPFVASLNHIFQANEKSPARIHIVWMIRNLQLITPVVSLFQSLANKFWTNQQEDRMEVRLHCTSKTVTNETLDMFIESHPYLGARLYRGRPDWKNLFEVWMDCYKRSRVGVFCSGPKSLSRKINEHVLVAASKGINFAYHHESFS